VLKLGTLIISDMLFQDMATKLFCEWQFSRYIIT